MGAPLVLTVGGNKIVGTANIAKHFNVGTGTVSVYVRKFGDSQEAIDKLSSIAQKRENTYELDGEKFTTLKQVSDKLGISAKAFASLVRKVGYTEAVTQYKERISHGKLRKQSNRLKLKCSIDGIDFTSYGKLAQYLGTTDYLLKKLVMRYGVDIAVKRLKEEQHRGLGGKDVAKGAIFYTNALEFSEKSRSCRLWYLGKEYAGTTELSKHLGCTRLFLNNILNECEELGSYDKLQKLDFCVLINGKEYRGINGLANYLGFKSTCRVAYAFNSYSTDPYILIKILELYNNPITVYGKTFNRFTDVVKTFIATKQDIVDMLATMSMESVIWALSKNRAQTLANECYMSLEDFMRKRAEWDGANFLNNLADYNKCVLKIGVHSFTALSELVEFMPQVLKDKNYLYRKLRHGADHHIPFAELIKTVFGVHILGLLANESPICYYVCPECGRKIMVNANEVSSFRHSDSFCAEHEVNA